MFALRRFWKWGWSPSPKTHLAIALAMTLVALTLFLVAFSYSYRQVTQNPIVDGIVVKSVSGASGVHTPIIEYRSPGKQTKRFMSRLSTRPQTYFVGDHVNVILVGAGLEPKVKNFFNVYGLSAFFLLFSAICALGSITIYFTRVKPKRG
ncbi:hypothetical protein [Microbulbifer sp. SAOS-129_SWC]|uniref:hypothetical protein n=1 Tax=Microbulbifer sp. SAOS-129_SWC TaxID=3145235 RepID=UPI0032168455